MEFLPEAIDRYAGSWTEPSGELLDRIERETWQEVLMPRMLSGHQQGRFLNGFWKSAPIPGTARFAWPREWNPTGSCIR
jgi:hypothetical protein